MRRKIRWTLVILGFLAVLTGIGAVAAAQSSPGPAVRPQTEAQGAPQPAAARSPGNNCAHVIVVLGAIQSELTNAPGGASFELAYKQFTALSQSVPEGVLRIDIDRANVDMTQYWLRTSHGETANRQATAFGQDMARISGDCS
jgi:hypothetical protein